MSIPLSRIIASRFPPIDLFERVTPDPTVWDALIAAEMLTNPRVRDELGDITLVPPEERISGPGTPWVMASFTHLNPKGLRFSDGSWGVGSPFTVSADEEGKAIGAQRSRPARAPIVRGLTKYPLAVEGLYYAAIDLATALAETIHHFEHFARDSQDPTRDADMRVLVGHIDQTFHDIASLPEPARTTILAPDDYSHSRALGRTLRETGSNGVVYPASATPGAAASAPSAPKPSPHPSRNATSATTGTAPASAAGSTTPPPPGSRGHDPVAPTRAARARRKRRSAGRQTSPRAPPGFCTGARR